MGSMNINNALNSYKTQSDISNTKNTQSSETNSVQPDKTDLGRTIGEPKLSSEAEKYYNQLKKKFGQYDFILVSSDEKENARANAGKYANNLKTVVLIDEEKIEKMATDEKFRKQYEGILSGATKQIEQIKAAAANAGTNLKGVIMQVNDNGTTSFFAALQKTTDAQKVRIEKKAEQKKKEKKAELKKSEKKAEQKRAEKKEEQKRVEENAKENNEVATDEDVVTIMADSFESLIKKIEEYGFNERSNNVMTKEEMMLGQSIDFRG